MLHEFAAYSLANELELNNLATQLGMNRKYRWEEPMILTQKELPDILPAGIEQGKVIYLFSFGSVVFINFTEREIDLVLKELREIQDNTVSLDNIETYRLEISKGKAQKITNHYAIIPEYKPNVRDMISTVIAKSVALERIEKNIEKIFDEIEGIVKRLELGKLDINDKRISKLVAKVMSINLGTLSYIMVLDKPDVTWNNILADKFYIEMAEIFELIDRYEDIKHKSSVIKETIDSFSNLAHAKRATRLELMIIYLILFEILYAFYEKGERYIWEFLRSLF